MRASLVSAFVSASVSAVVRPACGQELDLQPMHEVGLALRSQNQPESALRVFQLAYDLRRETSTLARIAQSELALDRFADAEEHLIRALDDGQDRWVREHLEPLRAALARTRASLGSVELRCNVAGSELWVDGARFRTLSLQSGPQIVRVRAGTRQLEVRSEGYEPDRRRVEIPVGTTIGARLSFNLVRIQRERERRETSPQGPGVGPWVLAGVGLAGLGTFLALQFGLRESAIGRYSELCPNDVCPPSNYPAAREVRSDVGFYGLLANISLGIGAATLGGATLWWLANRQAPRARNQSAGLHVGMTPFASGIGVEFSGRF